MSVVLERIQVSKTPTLVRALEAARRQWPDETRASRLVERLAVEGAQRLEEDTPEVREERFRAEMAAHPTRFPDDYLETVRAGWR